jgi:uncharacterized protein (DUF433 family)
MKTLLHRITIDSQICNGKPVIRGKRITVHTILEYLSAGDSPDDILREYPSLTRDDIRACLEFATALMEHQYSIHPLYRSSPLSDVA